MSANGIYPALSGAVAQSEALDNVANNLANVSTTGFRAQRLGFREVLAQAQPARGKNDQRFVTIGTPLVDQSPGIVRATGQPGDVALSGPGFLTVQTPSGVGYVRSATLTRDGQGLLHTQSGLQVLGVDGQPLSLPPGNASPMQIGAQGEIVVRGKQVGQLGVVEFPQPQALDHGPSGIYLPNANSGAAAAAQQTTVLDQHLEEANVSPLRAMTEVITTSRQYDALHRMIETFREVDGTAAQNLASIS